MSFRLLVCGGRNFNDSSLPERLNAWYVERPDIEIITGYDPHNKRFQGADELAFTWAVASGVPAFPFPARWQLYGRRAGPLRNQEMLDFGKPHAVLAAPGGGGTADMCSRALKAGLVVHELEPARTAAGRV